MRKVVIEVAADLTAEELLEMLQSETSLIGELVASDLRQHGDRAEVHEIRVTNVEFAESDPSEVTIYYEFSWSAYYGCRDINTGGDEDEHMVGVYEGSNLIFEVPEDRTTHEEY